ncbi:MAG: CBS domain-containing protein [Chloroflexi bacterium]|nr:CBS domain-containing protein [Chloroflexota bacterium]
MRDTRDTIPGEDEFTHIHELVYELRIGQVMTKNVFTLGPDNSIREAKELCRVNRISGVPVLEGDKLAGIISVEDIILALERNEIDRPLRERMTGRVVTIREEESVIQAVRTFALRRYGRLPVVDQSGRLVGIVTRGDIVRGLLKAIDIDYRCGELDAYHPQHVFEDLISNGTSITLVYRIEPNDLARGGNASGQIKKALGRIGIDPRVTRRVAIATYEAEMNIIIHAETGGQLRAVIEPKQISIWATDEGPGIANLEQALIPGFSTAPDWVRELGFGAGMGLNNIKASADFLEIDTAPGQGTRLHIVVRTEGRP